jgi:hypothetical protein
LFLPCVLGTQKLSILGHLTSVHFAVVNSR